MRVNTQRKKHKCGGEIGKDGDDKLIYFTSPKALDFK